MDKMICDKIKFGYGCPKSYDECGHAHEHPEKNCDHVCKLDEDTVASLCCVPSHYSIKEAKGYILRKLLGGG